MNEMDSVAEFTVTTCNAYPMGEQLLSVAIAELTGRASVTERSTVGYAGPNDILQFVANVVGWDEVMKVFALAYGLPIAQGLGRDHLRVLRTPGAARRVLDALRSPFEKLCAVATATFSREPSTSFSVGIKVGSKTRNAYVQLASPDEEAIYRAFVAIGSNARTIQSLVVDRVFRGPNARLELSVDSGNGFDCCMRLMDDGAVLVQSELIVPGESRHHIHFRIGP